MITPIAITMLTGDSRATAEAGDRELGIDEVEANVSPQDKHRKVEGTAAAMESAATAMSLSSGSVIGNAVPLRMLKLAERAR